MKKFKILFCLLFLLINYNLFCQEQPYTITKVMDFNKAKSFVKPHGIQVNTTETNWSVSVEVKTLKDLNFQYYEGCSAYNWVVTNYNQKMLIYAADANQDTPVNSNYRHYRPQKDWFVWVSANPFFNFPCRSDDFADSRRFYASGAHWAKHYKADYSNDKRWNSFQNKNGNVTVKITISDNLSLSDITSIKIPGIEAFSGVDFSSDLTASIYRESETVPQDIKFFDFNDPYPSLLNLKVGDSIVFESKHPNFNFEGLQEVWLARSGGESKYYATTNVNPGEIKPFIGFDSQVHGVAMRKYPENHKLKHDDITYDSSTGLYTWSWIAQRRMDSQKETFNPNQNNASLDKVKHASNFNRPNFPIGGGQTVTSQRNNQREGYNMQFLRNFQEKDANYTNYGNTNDYILGLDGDEIVYLNSQYAEVNSDHLPTALLQTEIEEWKRIQPGEFDDPILQIVDAYRKNRASVLSLPSPETFEAYEILDYNTYIIEPSLPQRPFNGKPYVKYLSNVNLTDDNNKAIGQLTFHANNNNMSIPIDVNLQEVNYDYGFDAIDGELWPAETQQQVKYSFRVPNKATYGRYIMEYTFENELGMLESEQRFYTPINARSDGLGQVWNENFDIKGWGYNEITVYFQRHPNAQKVMIAGKELLEINLRFMSVAGSDYQDFSQTPFGGIDLNEGRGEGKYWYLRDFNDDPNSAEEYGDRNYNFRKEYTIAEGEQLYFTLMDSDPHTFIHYKDEFYISERTMANRLLDSDINQRVKWYFAVEGFEGDKNNWTEVGTGRTYSTSPSLESGNYVFIASYNGSSDIQSKVTVLPFNYEPEVIIHKKGIINTYDLSPTEKLLVQSDPSIIDNVSDLKLAKVEDIFSYYTHIDGPRAIKPNNAQNRYGLENDFNNHFTWKKFNSSTSTETELIKILPANADKRIEWFPSNWIRHYSGATNQYPNDMIPAYIGSLMKKSKNEINAVLNTQYPTALPENWQWRLPWISTTNWSGYRTRVNIKAIYNMKAFFNNANGAFSGTGNGNYNTNEDYKNAVINAIPSFTDAQKTYYDFYNDVKSGRKLIFNPSTILPDNLIVYNVDDVDNTEYYIAGNKTFTKINYVHGADMSSVQNLIDKGITWSEPGLTGNTIDPYDMISCGSMNTVRFRLWDRPDYILPGNAKDGQTYNYGTLLEPGGVREQILKAKSKGFDVILDIHFSDTWADPKQNIIPSGWRNNDGSVPNANTLATKANNYLTWVLNNLSSANALPDYIQLGNEINSNIMLSEPYNDLTINEIASEIGVSVSQMNNSKFTINWNRMAAIINPLINNINSYNTTNNTDIKTILHIAGVSSAKKWIDDSQLTSRNPFQGVGSSVVTKPDFLGISYYPGEDEQNESIQDVKRVIDEIYQDHGIMSIIVETGFPKNYSYSDNTNNIQGDANANLPNSTSPEKQYSWLSSLITSIHQSDGGAGVVYWEPFWVGSNDSTNPMKDTVGSTWEHMSFFAFNQGIPSNFNILEPNGGMKAFCEINTRPTLDPGDLFVCTEYTLDAAPQSINYINNGCWSVNQINTNTTNAHNTPSLNSPQGWSAVSTSQGNYVGMLFDQPSGINGITTQGRANSNQWVTTYRLEGTKDGGTSWINLGNYTGNTDRNTAVYNSVSNTDTDWTGLRIVPITWVGHPTMRFEFSLCEATCEEYIQDPAPQSTNYINNGCWSVNQINTNSTNLHNTPQFNSSQAWSAKNTNQGNYVGMLFDQPSRIINVATKGRANWDQWVTIFELQGTKDGTNWQTLGTYTANENRNTSVVNQVFSQDTDWIGARILPITWNGHPSLRFEFTLCSPGTQNKSGNTDTKGSFDGDSELNLITFKDASVYPNPTSNEFNLTFNAEEKDSYNIKIADIQGRIINTQDINVENLGQQLLTFKNNGELTTGTYLIILSNEHKTQTFKLIIK